MKKILIALIALVTVASCQNLTDLNRDTKNPEEVPAGTLFANATVELFDFMVSTNVNVNNLRLWSQYWTETTYTDESNYELIQRNVNGRTWNILYATVLRDLKEARKFIDADPILSDENRKNQLAMISVLEAFTGHLLVDFFGDVPWSAALGDDITPAYDDDASVYQAVMDKLDAAIADLGGESGLGDFDLIYGGDVDMWKKFANGLKLRLAIRIANVDDAKAQSMATAAVNGGLIASSDENVDLAYTSSPPHTNPLWVDLVQSGRNDFVAANTLVDYMNDLQDPRRAYYFSDVTDSLGNPIGGIFGASNNYNEYSHPAAVLRDPTFPGTIMDYVEMEFLLADAAVRWGSAFGDAETHYINAITASILYWGGTQQEADDYLANPKVAWSTASGTDLEKIAMQKWLAMYNRGFEGWSTYRVYNAPVLNDAAEAGTPPPLRYIYPVDEYSLNGASVNDAIAANPGYDEFLPIFWDN